MATRGARGARGAHGGATTPARATAAVATATVKPARQRRNPAAVTVTTTAPAHGHGQTNAHRANQAITAIADPPGECPWCMSELGLPGTAGTTTRMCRWHEFTTWIQLATRYPVLWPKVRAEFGQAVLVRLVAPLGEQEMAAGVAGALVVDIAVQ